MRGLIIYLTAIASIFWVIPTQPLWAKSTPETRLINRSGKINLDTELLTAQNQPVELILTVYRQVPVAQNHHRSDGETEWEWQPLSPGSQVLPGETLRYQLVGKNHSSSPVNSLVLTQPIPSEMTYIPNSAQGASNITFSIDKGVSFHANPQITIIDENGQEVTQSAPPENYTHVRWSMEKPLAPGEEFIGTFEVKVK